MPLGRDRGAEQDVTNNEAMIMPEKTVSLLLTGMVAFDLRVTRCVSPEVLVVWEEGALGSGGGDGALAGL